MNNGLVMFSAGIPNSICEQCCEHFASELTKQKSKKTTSGRRVNYKELLVKGINYACSSIIVIGHAAFFCVAMWFVPHAESPFKRRERLLNEAFSRKVAVQSYGAQIEADYRLFVANASRDAEEALSRGLRDIKADEEEHKSRNYEHWKNDHHIYKHREDLLRRDVDDVFQSALQSYRLAFGSILNEQLADEKAADEGLYEARRSAYS